MVPSSVVIDEVLFKKAELGHIPEEINLEKGIREGKIIELAATAEDLSKLYEIFDRLFIEGLGKGEFEALALLNAGRAKDSYFCTGDKAPIYAIAMLGMADRAISMEKLLKSCGIQKTLKVQFTEKWFKEQLEIGEQKLITGEGLKEDYRNKVLL